MEEKKTVMSTIKQGKKIYTGNHLQLPAAYN
jgi:hypothetical protein